MARSTWVICTLLICRRGGGAKSHCASPSPVREEEGRWWSFVASCTSWEVPLACEASTMCGATTPIRRSGSVC